MITVHVQFSVFWTRNSEGIDSPWQNLIKVIYKAAPLSVVATNLFIYNEQSKPTPPFKADNVKNHHDYSYKQC